MAVYMISPALRSLASDHVTEPATTTRHPASPFRLLPFGLDELFDVPLERRSHRRRPSKFSLQMIPAFGATGDMLFDSAHFSLGEFLQGVALHHHDSQVGHGFHDSRFWRPRREGPVMLRRRSNRFKTWRQSHVDR